MTDFQTIRYETSEGLGRITMARPEKRNAMNPQMFRELGDAAELARDDGDVHVVIVEGEGPAFSAGLDLSAVGELASLRGPRFRSFVRLAQRPCLLLARMEKPAIAAVQGHAVGAGFQLALACDLRVVADDVKFGMFEARYGLIPDLGGLHHLVRLIGTGRTKELLWSTRPVEADEAERIGLANRVVPVDQLAKAVEDLAREVTTYSPTAVGLIKTLVSRATETALEQELEREGEANSLCLESDDHKESVAAFLEGRAPRFRP